MFDAIGSMFDNEPLISAPYRVEVVDLESVAAGSLVGQNRGQLPRWQCLVGPGEPAATIDLIEVPNDFKVVSINRGTLATQFAEAVDFADAIAGTNEYELRAFEIPALHFAAAHLIGNDLEHFIPIGWPAADIGLFPFEVYFPAFIAEQLSLFARRVLGRPD
ncbi:hypothetical protein ACXC9Q_29860 [Kribbella sp. CWNU-51]